MAFEWDMAQIYWLRNSLAQTAARFEDKIEVAGSSLEIDAAAVGAPPGGFFDFLSRYSVFENKAPSETLDEEELLRASARVLLLAEKWGWSLVSLGEVTLVVICSKMTRGLRTRLGGEELRPGILAAKAVTRVVIVEANRLVPDDVNLPVIARYASGQPLRRAIEEVVEKERREHYPVLWFLRRRIFREVLVMKGKTVHANEIDLAGAVEDIGIRRVVESVGVRRVIDEVGLPALLEVVEIGELIEAIGLPELERKIQEMKRSGRSRGD